MCKIHDINVSNSTKNIEHNGFKIKYFRAGDSILFKLSVLMRCIDGKKRAVTTNLHKISEKNILASSNRGRNSAVIVNQYGLYEYLYNSRGNLESKNRLISKINETFGFSFDEITSQISQEDVFVSNVASFFKEMGMTISFERQKQIGKYSVDICINKLLCVEFDENYHYSYNDKREDERDDFLSSSGFEIVHISNTDSFGKSMAIIYKKTLLIC